MRFLPLLLGVWLIAEGVSIASHHLGVGLAFAALGFTLLIRYDRGLRSTPTPPTGATP